MKYLEIQPARARAKRNLDDIWGRPEFVAEEKIDGWRFLMHLGNELDRVYMTGRRTSLRTGMFSEKGELVPQLWPDRRVIKNLSYTVLDGEITVPGGFRGIAGVMNTDPEKARKAIAEQGTPTYHVFDVLWMDGFDVRDKELIDRRKLLHQLQADVITGPLRLVEQHPPERRVFDDFVNAGGEGIILKDVLEPYGEGWIKVKRSHTLDVVITGFTEARFGRTGKYHGQIGAVLVSVYTSSGTLVEVGKVSGMTDDVRRHMTDHPREWIGTVVEVECQEYGKDRLRHPRYKRHRPDASPRDATFKKMMLDLRRSEDAGDEAGQLQLF